MIITWALRSPRNDWHMDGIHFYCIISNSSINFFFERGDGNAAKIYEVGSQKKKLYFRQYNEIRPKWARPIRFRLSEPSKYGKQDAYTGGKQTCNVGIP